MAAHRFFSCVKEPCIIRAIAAGKWEALDEARTEAIAKDAAFFFLNGFRAPSA
ncbi:MAG: hypothetical protein LBN32_00815 [Helicobacteraceae bacterium]|nr:hypothetical protein [Helicobacteraceae bacterium]